MSGRLGQASSRAQPYPGPPQPSSVLIRSLCLGGSLSVAMWSCPGLSLSLSPLLSGKSATAQGPLGAWEPVGQWEPEVLAQGSARMA